MDAPTARPANHGTGTIRRVVRGVLVALGLGLALVLLQSLAAGATELDQPAVPTPRADEVLTPVAERVTPVVEVAAAVVAPVAARTAPVVAPVVVAAEPVVTPVVAAVPPVVVPVADPLVTATAPLRTAVAPVTEALAPIAEAVAPVAEPIIDLVPVVPPVLLPPPAEPVPTVIIPPATATNPNPTAAPPRFERLTPSTDVSRSNLPATERPPAPQPGSAPLAPARSTTAGSAGSPVAALFATPDRPTAAPVGTIDAESSIVVVATSDEPSVSPD